MKAFSVLRIIILFELLSWIFLCILYDVRIKLTCLGFIFDKY